ncbi:putative RING-H2 finger protein ATL21A [Bienertia sinuspersici]
MPKLSRSGQCCQTVKCNTKTSNGHHNHVDFPFRIKDVQKESCGCEGFGLYCDNELGLLLELPYAGNFTVEYILFYSSRKILISDPSDCLPQKLLHLDLMTTPFRRSRSAEYRIYNCSEYEYPVGFSYEEKIDCLSGLDYTVISQSSSFIGDRNTNPNCTFVKQVSVPIENLYSSKSYLSSYSSVYLTWDGCETCGKNLHISILFF